MHNLLQMFYTPISVVNNQKFLIISYYYILYAFLFIIILEFLLYSFYVIWLFNCNLTMTAVETSSYTENLFYLWCL